MEENRTANRILSCCSTSRSRLLLPVGSDGSRTRGRQSRRRSHPKMWRRIKPEFSPYAGRNFPTRRLFGDTHLHTAISVDAGTLNRVGQEDAFRFARGEEVIIHRRTARQAVAAARFSGDRRSCRNVRADAAVAQRRS